MDMKEKLARMKAECLRLGRHHLDQATKVLHEHSEHWSTEYQNEYEDNLALAELYCVRLMVIGEIEGLA